MIVTLATMLKGVWYIFLILLCIDLCLAALYSIIKRIKRASYKQKTNEEVLEFFKLITSEDRKNKKKIK